MEIIETGQEEAKVDLTTNIEELARNQVARDYQRSKNAYRQKHLNYIEDLKRYKIPEDASRVEKGMSDATVPIINEAVNVIQADMVANLFKASGLNIDTIGREDNDMYAARAIRQMTKYQAYVKGMKAKVNDSIFSFLLYGMAPAKVCYREEWGHKTETVPITIPELPGVVLGYDKQKSEFLKYLGPDLEPIDLLDYFPSPDKIKQDDDEPICHRFYPSKSTLRERARSGQYKNVELVLAAMEESGAAHDPEAKTLKQQRQEIMGLQYQPPSEKDSPECIEWHGMFDIDGDGVEERAIITIAYVGDEPIIMRMDESPYHSQEDVFICGRFLTVPGEYVAMGLGELLRSDERAATSMLRAMIDSYYRVSRPRTKVMEGALADENELKTPWGTIHINENDYGMEAVQEMPPTMIGQDGYNLLNKIEGSVKARSAVADMMAGRIPGQKTTATVGSQAFGQASNRFRHFLWLFEESYILPLCRKMHQISQQYIDKPYAIMVLGDDGQYWVTVNQQQIAADVNFISLASSADADKQVAIEQLMRAIEISGSNPMTATVTVPLFVNLLELFDVRNIETLKTMLGYELMIYQAKVAGQMGITPQQMMAQQGLLFQQQFQGNQKPYGSGQEQTPTNQEEMIAKTNQSMTSNFPVAR